MDTMDGIDHHSTTLRLQDSNTPAQIKNPEVISFGVVIGLKVSLALQQLLVQFVQEDVQQDADHEFEEDLLVLLIDQRNINQGVDAGSQFFHESIAVCH